MARRPNYSFERRQRELGKAAKKEAKREAQREAVERRRGGGENGEAHDPASSTEGSAPDGAENADDLEKTTDTT